MTKLIFLFGIMFVMNLQPVFMVSVLIFITFIYSWMIYNVGGVYWFSYILLMVMMSGVLVVFTYMVTLTPNESFEMINLMVLLMVMVMLMISYIYKYINDYSMVSVVLWNTYLGIVSLFMVGFLLMVMLMVVMLSYIMEGAFRV